MVARLLDAGKRNYIGNESWNRLRMKRQISSFKSAATTLIRGKPMQATTTDNAKVIIGQQASLWQS